MVRLSQLGVIVLMDRSWVSIREGLVRRLADLELLSDQEVRDILPDMSVSEPWMGNGESLMVSFPSHRHNSADNQYRLASTPKSHLDAFAFTITYSPGAVRAFASEIIQVSRPQILKLIRRQYKAAQQPNHPKTYSPTLPPRQLY